MAINDTHLIDVADGDTLMDGVVSNESSDEGVQVRETTPDLHLPNGQIQPKPDEVPDETTTTNRSKPQYALKYILSGHTRSISSIKFSPDGTTLASSGTPLQVASGD
jgi:COMPASS component SWD3